MGALEKKPDRADGTKIDAHLISQAFGAWDWGKTEGSGFLLQPFMVYWLFMGCTEVFITLWKHSGRANPAPIKAMQVLLLISVGPGGGTARLAKSGA